MKQPKRLSMPLETMPFRKQQRPAHPQNTLSVAPAVDGLPFYRAPDKKE